MLSRRRRRRRLPLAPVLFAKLAPLLADGSGAQVTIFLMLGVRVVIGKGGAATGGSAPTLRDASGSGWVDVGAATEARKREELVELCCGVDVTAGVAVGCGGAVSGGSLATDMRMNVLSTPEHSLSNRCNCGCKPAATKRACRV